MTADTVLAEALHDSLCLPLHDKWPDNAERCTPDSIERRYGTQSAAIIAALAERGYVIEPKDGLDAGWMVGWMTGQFLTAGLFDDASDAQGFARTFRERLAARLREGSGS